MLHGEGPVVSRLVNVRAHQFGDRCHAAVALTEAISCDAKRRPVQCRPYLLGATRRAPQAQLLQPLRCMRMWSRVEWVVWLAVVAVLLGLWGTFLRAMASTWG